MIVSSKYKVGWTPKPGFTSLVKAGDAGLKYIDFGMLSLGKGKRFKISAADKETSLVLLLGAAVLHGIGKPATIGPRKSFFDEKPWTVMLPAGSSCEIEATEDCEIAIGQAPSKRKGEAIVVGPDKVKELTLGRGSWQRTARIMVDENVPADLLFIGEALTDDGRWSSYPPHRHEKDDLPDEVEMEEIYYFHFDRPQGFGIQKVYTDDRSIDETVTVGERDAVLVPRGYHPVVCAPGYKMYYLWIMAGKNRKFLQRLDPDHAWVAKK
jgi:5-deoxy-glucuronate isomerase